MAIRSQTSKAARLKLLTELLAIPGPSGQEKRVADYISDQLQAAGLDSSFIRFDNANRKTPIAGDTGNMVVRLPGTNSGARRLLMAHMDTVPICVGTIPKKSGKRIKSANKQTGLGADDRAGVAVCLITALEILKHELDHPPLTFLWTIQEEIGLYGARLAQLGLLGKPKLAFNWDGGAANKLTIGATGGYRMEIEVLGQASHAGGAPERGVSAIAISGLAIAELQKKGWHGDIRKGGKRGTSNIGVIEGGRATNVVTDRVVLRAEARSHDAEFRQRIIDAITTAFENAATEVKNVDGDCGSVNIEGRLDYDSFQLPSDEPSVLAACEAVRATGNEPELAISNGGLDANWLSARGIPTVTLGCGQINQHMVTEELDIDQFHQACDIALYLATRI